MTFCPDRYEEPTFAAESATKFEARSLPMVSAIFPHLVLLAATASETKASTAPATEAARICSAALRISSLMESTVPA